METPPTPKKGNTTPICCGLDATPDGLRYLYEGKCACRLIQLESPDRLEDVTIHCERCKQPFQFS